MGPTLKCLCNAINNVVLQKASLFIGFSHVSLTPNVITIFHWHNPFGRTMVLGSTQPLTEMSTRNTSWVKGGRCVGLTTLPPSCANCLEIWEPQTPQTLTACPGLQWDCFIFFYPKVLYINTSTWFGLSNKATMQFVCVLPYNIVSYKVNYSTQELTITLTKNASLLEDCNKLQTIKIFHWFLNYKHCSSNVTIQSKCMPLLKYSFHEQHVKKK